MRLITATTLDAARRLRPAWAQLTWDAVEAEIDLFLATTRARPHGARPHVIVALDEGGRALGMLLARVEPLPVLPSLPVVARLRPVMDTAVVVAGGVSGDGDARRALMEKLAADLRAGAFDAICMRDVEPGSEALACLRVAVPRTRRAPVVATPRWVIDLPDDYDAYRATLSRNLRRARGKQARALRRRYGTGLQLERYPPSRDGERLVADVEAVAARSYQREAGAGFVLRQHGPVVRETLPLDTCRAWVLRLDGRPVAFEIGWAFAGTYLGAFTAYDRDFRGEGVGGYVEQAALADLCADPEVRVYDHGPEDYAYKRRLSSRAVPLANAWAFSRTPRARLGWLMRTAFELARSIRRHGVIGWLRPGDTPTTRLPRSSTDTPAATGPRRREP